jgi:hypothetical protein
MHDRPAQGEEDDARALELELVVAASAYVETAEQHLGLELHELIAPRIGDAEHEARRSLIGGNDRDVAEEERRRWTREPREHDPRHERDGEQTDEGLERDDEVRRAPEREDMPVADRGERLNAEEERAQPVAAHTELGLAAEAPEPAEQIGPGEHRVEREIRRCDEPEETRPRDGEQRVIAVQVADRRETEAPGREAAVPIQ